MIYRDPIANTRQNQQERHSGFTIRLTNLLRRRPYSTIAAVLAAGLVVRVLLAFLTLGEAYDIDSYRIVGERFRSSPLDIYETKRWPYSPAYVPYSLVAQVLSRWTGLPFHGWIQVPPIVADLALAVVVVWWLGRRGASHGRQIWGAALVALGPAFILISGYQGQFDSLAILPAAVACLIWQERLPRRSLLSGLLVGVGIALKTVPGFILVALLPTARSLREAVKLIFFAGLLPLALLLPYLLATPNTLQRLRYSGFPGAGGLSIVVQPHLADAWLLSGVRWSPTPLTRTMWHWTAVMVASSLILLLLALRAWRADPLDASVLVWLTVYTVSWSFFFQYTVWVLPFLLLAGRPRAATWLQAAVIAPGVVFFMRPWTVGWVADAYKVAMTVLWVGFALALVLWTRRLWLARRPEPTPHAPITA